MPDSAFAAPDWRAALSFIVLRAAAHEIALIVSGGASFALHGIPVPVRDLDLLTNRAGAYRFQQVFAEHMVEPVAYRTGTQYRSHFGRFVIQGVPGDVMAELEWREQDRWQPIFAATRVEVDLDGTLVTTPWPEEEFLAAIRRGRLDRAAVVLPHLDHMRLLRLLRGEIKTGML